MTDVPSDRPPYPPQPGQPGGYGPSAGYPAARPRNGVGTAALVVGVVAVVLVVLLLFAPLGALLGLVALLLGILGLIRVNQGVADNRGQAVTGLITGAVALLIGALLTVSFGAWFATHTNDFNRFGQCMDDASGAAAREACARRLARDLE